MPIATSRQYIVVSNSDGVELWDPFEGIRTHHTLGSDVRIVKVEAYRNGGLALTDQGKVLFFSQTKKWYYSCPDPIADLACTEKEVVLVTNKGKFLSIGRRPTLSTSAPPPVSLSLGPAKLGLIACGKLFFDEQEVSHHCLILQAAVGGGHTVFLDEEGKLYGFGNNHRGQLGRGIVQYAEKPIVIPFEHKIVKIAAGHEHTVVLDDAGLLYITGSGVSGQLGDTIKPIDDCRFGLTVLARDVVDVVARGNVTLCQYRNGDIQSVGVR